MNNPQHPQIARALERARAPERVMSGLSWLMIALCVVLLVIAIPTIAIKAPAQFMLDAETRAFAPRTGHH